MSYTHPILPLITTQMWTYVIAGLRLEYCAARRWLRQLEGVPFSEEDKVMKRKRCIKFTKYLMKFTKYLMTSGKQNNAKCISEIYAFWQTWSKKQHTGINTHVKWKRGFSQASPRLLACAFYLVAVILAAREREQQRAGGRDNTGPSYRPGTRQKDSKKQNPSLGREPETTKTCMSLSWVLIGSLLGNSFCTDWSGTGDHTIPQWIGGDSIDEDHSEGGDDIGDRSVKSIWDTTTACLTWPGQRCGTHWSLM